VSGYVALLLYKFPDFSNAGFLSVVKNKAAVLSIAGGLLLP
jgi:hypothetical protein